MIFFPARTCCFEAADMFQDNWCMRVVTISESYEKPFSAAVYAKDLQIVHWLRETLVTQATSRSIKFWSTYTKQVILAALILRYLDAKLNELSVCLIRRQWKKFVTVHRLKPYVASTIFLDVTNASNLFILTWVDVTHWNTDHFW